MKKQSILFGAWLSFFVGISFAEDAPPATPGAGDAACAQDIKTLCGDVRGPRHINKCLKEHEAEVSQACKEHRAALRDKAKNFHQVCQNDIQTYCKDVKPGRAAIWRCIKANEAALSEECKAFVQQTKTPPNEN